MSNASVGHTLAALLLPVVAETGLDLEDVVVSGQGRRTEVRVLVDKDGGVSLDDVALVTNAVSAALDLPVNDAIIGAPTYTLEVSSPGVERPLTQPRHWRRAVTRLVRVKTPDGEVTARVAAADDIGVRMVAVSRKPGAAANEVTVDYADLGPGHVQVEFNHSSSNAPDEHEATRPADREESR